MKKTYAIVTSLILALGASFTYAQDDIEKVKVKDDKVKVKTEDGQKVKVKGENAPAVADEILSPEVVGQLQSGYRVPTQYRTHFRPVHVDRIETLTPAPAGQTVRVYDNTAYYMSNDTWEIQRTVPIEGELGADVFIDVE